MVFGEKFVFEITFSRWQFSLLAAMCVVLALPDKLGSETATLTTYYAAPVSSYDSLRVRTYAAIGTTNVSSAAQGTVNVTKSAYLAVGDYLGSGSTTLGLRIENVKYLGGDSELMLNVYSASANGNSDSVPPSTASNGRIILAPANGKVTFNAPIANLCKWVRYDSIHGQGVAGDAYCSTLASDKYSAIAVGVGVPPNVKVTFKANSISKNGAYVLCCHMTFF